MLNNLFAVYQINLFHVCLPEYDSEIWSFEYITQEHISLSYSKLKLHLGSPTTAYAELV